MLIIVRAAEFRRVDREKSGRGVLASRHPIRHSSALRGRNSVPGGRPSLGGLPRRGWRLELHMHVESSASAPARAGRSRGRAGRARPRFGRAPADGAAIGRRPSPSGADDDHHDDHDRHHDDHDRPNRPPRRFRRPRHPRRRDPSCRRARACGSGSPSTPMKGTRRRSWRGRWKRDSHTSM